MVSRTRQLERCNFEISVRIWTGSCAPSSQILSVLRGVRISRRASLLLLEILYCRVVKSRSSVTSLTHCRLRLVRDRGEIFLHLMCTPYGRCRTRRERRDKMKSVDCLQYGTGMTALLFAFSRLRFIRMHALFCVCVCIFCRGGAAAPSCT